MPFKIPRLEVKSSSQRLTSFTQDSSYSSSQLDLLGTNFCSQNSRDSAIDSSQSDNFESRGFWTSLRGSIENEKRIPLNNCLTNSTAAAVANIVSDIWDTVTEIDALMIKFFVEPFNINETDRFHSKLEKAMKMLKSCLENAKGLFAQEHEITSIINALRNTLRKILSPPNTIMKPHTLHRSICGKSSLTLKIDSFTSNLDFLIKLARKKIESARRYSSRLKRPHPLFCMSTELHRPAPGREIDTSAAHTHEINTRGKFSVVPVFTGNAKHNALSRKTPEFPIKFCDKVAAVAIPRKIGLQHGSNQYKPNVRWRQSNQVCGRHTEVRDSPSPSPIFSDGKTSVTQHLQPSLEPMGDIFCDTTEEFHDDDGFSSISDDCISLNALLEIEQ